MLLKISLTSLFSVGLTLSIGTAQPASAQGLLVGPLYHPKKGLNNGPRMSGKKPARRPARRTDEVEPPGPNSGDSGSNLNGNDAGFVSPPGPEAVRVPVYNKERIKRTVPLNPALGLAGRWDMLYQNSREAVYMDWDDTFLYLARESRQPEDVRFDLDGSNGGWLSGADNLAVQTSGIPRMQRAGQPQITVLRLDAKKDKDRPSWVASPIPYSEIRTVFGQTPRRTFAVEIAIPRLERLGLPLEVGKNFGLRVHSSELTPLTRRSPVLSPIPMLRLALADQIDGAKDGVKVRARIEGKKDVAPDSRVKTVLEITNLGKTSLNVPRFFMRGSDASVADVDDTSFTGTIIKPGERIERKINSAIAPNAPSGTLVFAGGVELASGKQVASLASFNRIEPYTLTVEIDNKPIPAGEGSSRKVTVIARSRSHESVNAEVELVPPPGWEVEKKETRRKITLTFPGDKRSLDYHLIVPDLAAPGIYLVEATMKVDGRVYTAATSLTVTPIEPGTASPRLRNASARKRKVPVSLNR